MVGWLKGAGVDDTLAVVLECCGVVHKKYSSPRASQDRGHQCRGAKLAVAKLPASRASPMERD